MRPCKTFEEGVELLRGQAGMALEGDELDKTIQEILNCNVYRKVNILSQEAQLRIAQLQQELGPLAGMSSEGAVVVLLVLVLYFGGAGGGPRAAGAFVPGAALAAVGQPGLVRSLPLGRSTESLEGEPGSQKDPATPPPTRTLSFPSPAHADAVEPLFVIEYSPAWREVLFAVLANQRGRPCYLLDVSGKVYTFQDGRLHPDSDPAADVFPLRLNAGEPFSVDKTTSPLTPTMKEQTPRAETVDSTGGSGDAHPSQKEVAPPVPKAPPALPNVSRCQALAADALAAEDADDASVSDTASTKVSIYEDGSYWKRLGFAF